MTKLKFVLLAVLVVACAVGVWIYFQPRSVGPADSGWRPVPAGGSTNLEDENTPEFSRHFTRDAAGRVTEVFIQYRNGETGQLWLHPESQTVRQSRFTFADGKLRSEALYAEDGKTVLQGREVRADGSTIWQTTSSGDVATTVVNWGSGSRFAVLDRNVKTGDARYQIWRQSGKLWVDRQMHAGDLVSQTTWDADGKVALQVATAGDDLTVTVFAAGKPEFRQLWRKETSWSYGYGDEFGYGYGYGDEEYTPPAPTPVLTLKEVEVYGRDGKTPVKKLTYTWGSLNQIEVFTPRGITRKYVYSDGSVYRVEFLDKQGKQIGSQYGPGLGAEVIDKRWDAALPTLAEQLEAFKKQ